MLQPREYVGCLVLNPEKRVAVISSDAEEGEVAWSLPMAPLRSDRRLEESAEEAVFEQMGISRLKVRGTMGTYDIAEGGASRRVHLLAMQAKEMYAPFEQTWWLHRDELRPLLTDASRSPEFAALMEEIAGMKKVRRKFRDGEVPVMRGLRVYRKEAG